MLLVMCFGARRKREFLPTVRYDLHANRTVPVRFIFVRIRVHGTGVVGGYNILARTTRLAQSLGNVPLIRNEILPSEYWQVWRCGCEDC